MENLMQMLNTAREMAKLIGVFDIIDIALIAFLIYHVFRFIRRSRSGQVAKAILIIIVAMSVANLLHLRIVSFLLNNAVQLGLIALIIIFQPEIRRALEQLGTNHLFELFSIAGTKDKPSENEEDTIDAIVRASYSMGRAKTGALIVVEQKFVLNEYIATGIVLDAIVSAPLLVQIFEHNLPLHDGAVVIRGNRIMAATCYLPLSENKTISKELGTRHRAGLGISEVTDALTVIVSEETGQVSLTKDGQLYRNIDSDRLRELLGGEHKDDRPSNLWDKLRKGRKRHEK